MRPVHNDPEDALRAYRELVAAAPSTTRGTVMAGMHWGTFKLTDEPMDEPPRRVRAAWDRAGLPAHDLWLLRHGETRAVIGERVSVAEG
jgi:L-ascorbate metabolism protein UlaG (beta-lactamase superfamily)